MEIVVSFESVAFGSLVLPLVLGVTVSFLLWFNESLLCGLV